MSDEVPGPLIGEGRAADIFDIGDGLVLRRNRSGHSTETAAAVMRHLAEHGYPVPRVADADGADIVMERVDGRTMVDVFARTPWRLGPLADMLADLHRRLALVPAPGVALEAPFGPGDSLLHLDLHPLNVLITDRGPVVIDWDNAAIGPAAAEPANTWLIVATSQIDGSGPARLLQEAGRALFLRRFLRGSRDEARRRLRAVGDRRLLDPNLRPEEADAVRRLVAAEAIS